MIKDEYDFKNGVRGKFYRANAIHVPPIHLESDVLAYLSPRAEKQGTTIEALVNKLLKKDIELVEMAR